MTPPPPLLISICSPVPAAYDNDFWNLTKSKMGMFHFDNLQSTKNISHPWKILHVVNLTCSPSSRGWLAQLFLVSCFSSNIGKIFLPISSVYQIFSFVVELFFSSLFFLKLIRRHILRVLSSPTVPYKSRTQNIFLIQMFSSVSFYLFLLLH